MAGVTFPLRATRGRKIKLIGAHAATCDAQRLAADQ